jgi:hypothetical protein
MQRRIKHRAMVRRVLEQMLSAGLDPYEGYRRLYIIWSSDHKCVKELRPLFRIPDSDPDGAFSVTDEFRAEVLRLARAIAPHFA